MTVAPPQLQRCLVFITGRLAKASRDAELRPSKAHQARLRSLELLAAACVAEAARITDQGRPAVRPRLDPEPPAPRPSMPPAAMPSDEVTDPGLRGVWTPPPG
jgi:hypothetical protein